MGDPKKNRKTYSRPKKPWDKPRLDAERILVNDYGIANKLEIYKMRSLLKKFSLQAKKLMSSNTPQTEQEKKALLSKLHSLALVGPKAQLDDVLALELKNILERRLQTIVLRKGFANTIKQARQLIVHQHIRVGNNSITSPSYIVSKEEENNLAFVDKSPFANPEHPERPETIFKIKEASKKKKEPIGEVKAEAKKGEIAEKKEIEVEIKSEIKRETKALQKDIKTEIKKEEKIEAKEVAK